MIELFAANTPNGQKITILLEELDIPYDLQLVDLGKLEQKQDWFLALNPNGRIPVIKDKANDDFVVFESGAILLYLAEHYGKGAFFGQTGIERSTCLQWLMFQMGGVGPMMGQANVFFRYTEKKIPYAIDRYQNESRRLLEVLDTRLQETEYLAGNYGIADMSTYPWVKIHNWAGVSVDGLDALSNWMAAISVRPAVQRGLEILTQDASMSGAENTRASAKSVLVN